MHFQTFTDFLCLGFQKRMKKNRLEFFRNAAEKKVRTNLVPTIDESDSLRNFFKYYYYYYHRLCLYRLASIAHHRLSLRIVAIIKRFYSKMTSCPPSSKIVISGLHTFEKNQPKC